MENQIDGFIWSGYEWSIEDNVAYFVDAEKDILCELDLKTSECGGLAVMPNKLPENFMLNTRCLKINNEIFCMPCFGDRIWIYNCEDSSFNFIKLKKPERYSLYMEYSWQINDKVVSVSRGLCQVIIIDIKSKQVEYFPIKVLEDDILISNCIRVNTNIYCTSLNSNEIYKFDIESKETYIYSVGDKLEKFSCICFDGEKFWVSGCSRKVYTWDGDSVTNIINLPEGIRNYNFTTGSEDVVNSDNKECSVQIFCHLEFVKGYIWAIPFRSNLVIYIDKNTLEVKVLHIEGEKETKDSLLKFPRRPFKYFWQYIKNSRYIGIFSLKNNYVIEIDTFSKEANIKNYSYKINYLKMVFKGQIFYETNNLHRKAFHRYLTEHDKDINSKDIPFDIGKRIYEAL